MVNTDLQYTHGDATILSLFSQADANQPTFTLSEVPPVTAPGTPSATVTSGYGG